MLTRVPARCSSMRMSPSFGGAFKASGTKPPGTRLFATGLITGGNETVFASITHLRSMLEFKQCANAIRLPHADLRFRRCGAGVQLLLPQPCGEETGGARLNRCQCAKGAFGGSALSAMPYCNSTNFVT